MFSDSCRDRGQGEVYVLHDPPDRGTLQTEGYKNSVIPMHRGPFLYNMHKTIDNVTALLMSW